MSGGHFDYGQFHLNDIAEQIQMVLDGKYDHDSEAGSTDFGLSKDTVERAKILIKDLERCGKNLHLLDYLVEGDIGEDTLRKDWKDNEVGE